MGSYFFWFVFCVALAFWIERCLLSVHSVELFLFLFSIWIVRSIRYLYSSFPSSSSVTYIFKARAWEKTKQNLSEGSDISSSFCDLVIACLIYFFLERGRATWEESYFGLVDLGY